MRQTSHCRKYLKGSIAAVAGIVLTSAASAATLFWDGTDSTANADGGAGTWNTTLTNWDTAASSGANSTWSNSNPDIATFGGTASTSVILGSGITAGGITFTTGGYTIGTSTFTLTMASGAVIKSAGNMTETFTGTLAAADSTFHFLNTSTTNNFANNTLFTVTYGFSGTGVNVDIQNNGGSAAAPVVLSGTLTYTGTTTVAANAALGLSTSTISGLTNGSISMGANSTLLRTGGNLNQTVLDKIAATANSFTIVANNAGTSSTLDLTNLPNASLAVWDNAGTQTFAFTGAITAGSNGYRFGSSRAGNTINIGGTNTSGAVTPNILTGSAGLTFVSGTIGSNPLNLWGANTFSGNTINNVSGRAISINHPLAMQNSAIDTSGAGTYILGTGSSGTNGSGATVVTTPTIGGLIGSKNLLTSVIATTGYNTMTSLTLNPGTGVTNTYSGVIANSTAGLSITKTGAGTQIFSGLNSFSGNVNISNGTLAAAVAGSGGNSALGSVSNTRTINVNAGGTLRFDVGNVFNNNFASAATSLPVLNINGGTMTNSGSATNSALGNITLTGGTLTAPVGSGTGYGSWNLNGTVTSTGASAISTSASVPITLSAAAGTTTTFDVQSGTLTVSAELGQVTATGDERTSGLTKTGAGTMVLSGTNSYTGATLLSGGTLTFSGAGSANTSSGITVSGSGAKLLQTSSAAISPAVTLTLGTLTGSGTVNTVNVASDANAIITNNDGVAGAALTIGTLTFNGAATVNTFSASTSAPIVTTSLVGNGSASQTVINPTAASWNSGSTYDLISYGGVSITGAGGFGQFIRGSVTGLVGRQAASNLIDSGSAIQITISGDAPKWTGLDNGNWQIGSTGANENWKLQTAGTPTTFLANDLVLFDDTATGTITVDINAANVAPTSTVFSNSTLNYTLGSTGGFGISTGTLTKTGNGNLTISSINTYTGATTINGGTVTMSGSGTLGSGSALTLGGGNLDLGATSQTVGAVSITAPAASGDTISNGSLTGTSYAASNATGNAIISANLLVNAAAGFAKTGAGTVTFSGNNSYTGVTAINGGTITMSGSGTLGSGAGLTMGGGNLDLGTTSQTVGAVSVTTAAASGDTISNGNLTGTSYAVSNTTGNAIISANLLANGTAGFAKTGAGTATLSGTNTFTGTVSITGGTVVMANTQALGLPTANVTLNGATLDIATAGGDTAYNLTTGSGNAATLVSDVASGSTGINHTLGNYAVGGSTTAGVTKLNVTAGAGIISGSPSITLGQVNMTSGTSSPVISTFNPTTANLIIGSVTNGNGSATNTRTLNLDGTSTGNQITGAITNGASAPTVITKTNTSTWTLSGSSTYTGATTVTGGTLTFDSSSSFNPGVAAGTLTVNGATAVANIAGSYTALGNGNAYFATQNGGTLNFSGTATLGDGLTSGGIRIGDGSAGTMNMTGGTLTANLVSGSNFNLGRLNTTAGSGTLNLSGGTLTVTGAGGLLVGNGNGLSGVVTISGTGELVRSGSGAFAMGSGTGIATLNLNTGGTLTLGSSTSMTAGGTSTINFNGGTLKAGVSSTTLLPATGLTEVNISTNGGTINTNTFDDTIPVALLHDAGLGATPDGGLAKAGAGTLVLSSTGNTYTGATTVSSGTLEVQGSLSGTTGVAVNSGTLLLNSASSNIVNTAANATLGGGTLAFGNVANQVQNLGTLGVSASSVIEFGLGGGNDTFRFSGVGTRAGGAILTINNWNGNPGGSANDGDADRLVFSGNASDFTTLYPNSTDVLFDGIIGYTTVDLAGGGYEIVPVPEPATTALVGSVALCALTGCRRRRR